MSSITERYIDLTRPIRSGWFMVLLTATAMAFSDLFGV